MYFGEHRHQIDEKGRIRIPPKIKQMLGSERLFITRSASTSKNKCLIVLPEKDANSIFDASFGGMNVLTDDTKSVRVMASSGFIAEEDKAGRILLPQRLIAYAGLSKNIVTAGVYNRVEIWDEQAWDKYNNADSESQDEDSDSQDGEK